MCAMLPTVRQACHVGTLDAENCASGLRYQTAGALARRSAASGALGRQGDRQNPAGRFDPEALLFVDTSRNGSPRWCRWSPAAAGLSNGASASPTTGGCTVTTGRIEHLNSSGLIRNPAFTNVAVVYGPVKTIYVGGQDAVTPDGEVVGKGDLAAQTEQILANIQTALEAAGAGIENVIKWNLLVVEGHDLRPGFGVFQRVWGDRPNPPLITMAFVAALAQPELLAEMDAIPVLPE